MRSRDYIRQSQRRIAKAEVACHATILRAFDRLMKVLNDERTAWRIRQDHAQKLGAKSAQP